MADAFLPVKAAHVNAESGNTVSPAESCCYVISELQFYLLKSAPKLISEQMLDNAGRLSRSRQRAWVRNF